MKKVSFNEKIQIKQMYVWTFASKEARRGNWHWIIRDRQLFEDKCKLIEENISYI